MHLWHRLEAMAAPSGRLRGDPGAEGRQGHPGQAVAPPTGATADMVTNENGCSPVNRHRTTAFAAIPLRSCCSASGHVLSSVPLGLPASGHSESLHRVEIQPSRCVDWTLASVAERNWSTRSWLLSHVLAGPAARSSRERRSQPLPSLRSVLLRGATALPYRETRGAVLRPRAHRAVPR